VYFVSFVFEIFPPETGEPEMKKLKIGAQEFEWGARTYVMGILNITPDSFSGDGLYPSLPAQGETEGRTLVQAQRFASAGAVILDVGGESTRPGAQAVSAEQELERILPVIRLLAAEFPEIVLSIDTYKAVVAEEALKAGAHLVNDVWGLRADPALAEVIARRNVPVVLMHNRSKPSNAQVQEQLGGRYIGMEYDDLIADVKAELMESVQLARAAGIPDEHMILDPGIGFGKTVEQNLELLNHLDEIRALGFPVLLGPSRKSFIGYTLNLPPDQRVEGTAAAVAVGIARGADIVRVHDVEMMARVARMSDAIVRQKG
jgi:dihydropteroate synthase